MNAKQATEKRYRLEQLIARKWTVVFPEIQPQPLPVAQSMYRTILQKVPTTALRPVKAKQYAD